MKSTRLTELDSLRGIAAILVVLYHYTSRYDALYGHSKEDYFYGFGLGHYGVQLFFIISGFVIYMTLSKVKSVKDFTFKRVIRLYPAYIFSVLLTAIIVLLFGLEGRQVSFFDTIVNLTMFQGFIPGIDLVDGVYWSLRIEITFYILMGCLLFFKLQKHVLFTSGLLLLTSTILQILPLVLNSNLILILQNFSISGYIHLFILGIIFFELKGRKDNSKYCHLIVFFCIVYDFLFLSIESGLITTLMVSFFYLLIKGKLNFLNLKPLIFLGTISYSLYLVHQNIGYIIIRKMESLNMTHELFVLIPLIISIGLAVGITNFIEKPIQNILQNKYKKIKTLEAKIKIGSL